MTYEQVGWVKRGEGRLGRFVAALVRRRRFLLDPQPGPDWEPCYVRAPWDDEPPDWELTVRCARCGGMWTATALDIRAPGQRQEMVTYVRDGMHVLDAVERDGTVIVRRELGPCG